MIQSLTLLLNVLCRISMINLASLYNASLVQTSTLPLSPTLEGQNGYELRCGSHVDRMLSKKPPTYRDGFDEYCLNHGILQSGTDQRYNLPNVDALLHIKSRYSYISSGAAANLSQ